MSSNEGTKIKLEFRGRRDGDEHLHQVAPTGDDFQYGLNGEAFVPDALPGDFGSRPCGEDGGAAGVGGSVEDTGGAGCGGGGVPGVGNGFICW